jgi:N4-gp56 family major capsid protein
MANAFTSTGSATLGGTVGAAGLVQKAYDRLLEFALRSEPLIRSVADKRPARQAIPGSTVVLQRYVDLDSATSTLTETTDPDAVALTTPTLTTITLAEYGNAVLVTRALELFSLADVDPAIANIIAYNLADSIDKVAMTELGAGDNVLYGGSATSTATILLLQQLIQQTFVRLSLNSVLIRPRLAVVLTTGQVFTLKFPTTCVQSLET